MINQPMSPELVRLVHERTLAEAARRGEIARQLRSGSSRPSGLRVTVGAALVRAGLALSARPADAVSRQTPPLRLLTLGVGRNRDVPCDCRPSPSPSLREVPRATT